MSLRPPRPAAPASPTEPLDRGKLSLVEAYCADAEKLLLEDRFHEARKVVQQALRLMPNHPAAVHILGVIEMESGSLEEAAKLIKRTTELDPTAPDPFYFLGMTYGQLGRHEAAAAAFKSALALKPDLRTVLTELAKTLEILGRKAEALEIIRRRIELDPADTGALYHLAKLNPTAVTEEERARLQAHAADEAPEGADPVACFGMAEILETEGSSDKAFVYLKRGNDLIHEQLTKDDGKLPSQLVLPRGGVPRRMAPLHELKAIEQATSFAEAVFDENFMAQYGGYGHPSNLPVLIVGMPRSGSTLIEQILSSHPEVEGAGEIDAAQRALVDMKWPFQDYLQRAPDGALRPSPPPKPANRYFRELGAGYVKALRSYSAKALRITDKMLSNHRHAGMVHLCLPNAVILHAVRDPVDTCFGCYKQIFATGQETTYNLALLGKTYVLYRRIMARWNRVLPGRVVDVVYERLVADPEAETRRLLAACGLTWNDACLRFYENRRPVTTASVSQVRQPIFTNSIQRWRRYETHLGQLLDALGPYAPARGPAQKDERGS